MPPRYKCKLCSKWKPHGCFSNRELKNYRLKAATGVQVNGASALLRCVGCTEEPRHELECQGPCGKTLALAAFSKSSRKAGGNKVGEFPYVFYSPIPYRDRSS